VLGFTFIGYIKSENEPIFGTKSIGQKSTMVVWLIKFPLVYQE